MKLQQFAQMRGYQSAHNSQNNMLLDQFLNGEQGDAIRADLKLKRIQFDTVPQLSDELENICTLLECSKREFLEFAVRDAIDRAQADFLNAFEDAAGAPFEVVYAATQGE